MTASASPAPVGVAAVADPGWRRLVRDHPILPLSALLIVLIGMLELVQPGTVGTTWAGFALRAAIPLAILGACQTLAMLTGGIDLSIGTTGRWPPSWSRPRRPARDPWLRSPSASGRPRWPGS